MTKSNIETFAERELDIIGMTADSEDEMNRAMREHLLTMIRTFDAEGHSGFSASYAISCLEKLLQFKPLTPLTGADDEWTLLDDGQDEGFDHMKWQNNRCYSVFKDSDGRAYHSDAFAFREKWTDEDGEEHTSYFTSRDSRRDITFPYTPKTEYMDR
jgi:hypothetical protein